MDKTTLNNVKLRTEKATLDAKHQSISSIAGLGQSLNKTAECYTETDLIFQPTNYSVVTQG